MKAWIKIHTVDRYLEPLRQQLLKALPDGVSLLEIGCGTGDLLFRAAPQISYGLGVDANPDLISYAQQKKQKNNLLQLSFKAEHLQPTFDLGRTFDFGVASLFFHVLPNEEAILTLKTLKKHCDKLLIAAFVLPSNRKEEWLMWFDQRFSGHYQHYRKYANQGYMDGLLQRAEVRIRRVEATFDPCINLYTI